MAVQRMFVLPLLLVAASALRPAVVRPAVVRVPRRAATASMDALSDAAALMGELGPEAQQEAAERLARERGLETPEERIKALIAENKVMLFIKGTKLFPQCGFSNTAVNLIQSITQDFETFDVLSDDAIREGVKQFSAWPTIPQCYVDGEFIGGADILIEMHESGELKEVVEKAVAE